MGKGNRRAIAMREVLRVVVKYPLISNRELRNADPDMYLKYRREIEEANKRAEKLAEEE